MPRVLKSYYTPTGDERKVQYLCEKFMDAHNYVWCCALSAWGLGIDQKLGTIRYKTPLYIFPERSFRDLSKNIWVVASIVNRFRDKRKKRNETETTLLKWGRSFNLMYTYRTVINIRCTFLCAEY